MTEDHIARLLAIVKGFANPVECHHGIPTSLDMNCLRQDAVKLIEEIENDRR